MSTSYDGLQFPIHPENHKPSTSSTGKQIIAEALATVDHQSSVDALAEKNWRRGPESNRANRICNPGHNRFATAP